MAHHIVSLIALQDPPQVGLQLTLRCNPPIVVAVGVQDVAALVVDVRKEITVRAL